MSQLFGNIELLYEFHISNMSTISQYTVWISGYTVWISGYTNSGSYRQPYNTVGLVLIVWKRQLSLYRSQIETTALNNYQVLKVHVELV